MKKLSILISFYSFFIQQAWTTEIHDEFNVDPLKSYSVQIIKCENEREISIITPKSKKKCSANSKATQHEQNPPYQFRLWDPSDFRFFDLNHNKRMDINELIEGHLYDKYDQDQTLNLFYELHWPGPSNQESLGLVLAPLYNPDTEQYYCPQMNDYNHSPGLMSILGAVIGQETQSLYIGAKWPTYDEYILISQSQLEKIGLISLSGESYIINQSDLDGGKKIKFHWPANYNEPTRFQTGQSIYFIIHPSQFKKIQEYFPINNSQSVPLDKKIGCIPITQ